MPTRRSPPARGNALPYRYPGISTHVRRAATTRRRVSAASSCSSQIGYEEVRSFARESQRDGPLDAGIAAGNQHFLVLQASRAFIAALPVIGAGTGCCCSGKGGREKLSIEIPVGKRFSLPRATVGRFGFSIALP